MKRNYFKSILAASLLIFSMSSCLKDENRTELDPEKGVNVIEFANPGQINTIGTPNALYTLSYPIINTPTTVPISVAYVGPEDVAPQDITVNIGVGSMDLITAYNTSQSSTYTMMGTNLYSIPTTQIVIPKGQKTATFNVLINTGSFSLTAAYALPLEITSVSSGTISGNFGKILMNFGAKNAVDGLYNYKTSATTALVPNANYNDVPLVTTGANTVRTNLLDTYSNIITYNIDFTTNKVTVVSIVGSIGTPITDPVSNWNPATKVMYVKWTAGVRSFEETYTYQGVR